MWGGSNPERPVDERLGIPSLKRSRHVRERSLEADTFAADLNPPGEHVPGQDATRSQLLLDPEAPAAKHVAHFHPLIQLDLHHLEDGEPAGRELLDDRSFVRRQIRLPRLIEQRGAMLIQQPKCAKA